MTNHQTTPEGLRASRAHQGVSLIRLLRDLGGAAYEPVFKAGDTVEARWMPADAQWPAGWQVIGCGFFVRLSNDDVGIVER